ncbi:P63C domain-containing protein [Sulfurospirillum diekertiae]|uniref:P63C domain-containing protein n=1 Tax=Sulfurospirillum diekertiae TaxID=1854492 RepID=UPI001EDCE302
MQKWVKRFPDEFFLLLDKIYVNPATSSRNRPKYYGKFINKYIYEPIERGYLKSKLDELNINDDKTRKARFHQWLTDFGASQLTLQLGKVMSMLEFSPNLDKFKENIRRQQGLTIQPKLFEDL